MTVKELMEKLKNIQEEHGDCEVIGDHQDISDVLFCDKDGEYPAFLMLTK